MARRREPHDFSQPSVSKNNCCLGEAGVSLLFRLAAADTTGLRVEAVEGLGKRRSDSEVAALAVALAVAWVTPLEMHVWKGGSAADQRFPTEH